MEFKAGCPTTNKMSRQITGYVKRRGTAKPVPVYSPQKDTPNQIYFPGPTAPTFDRVALAFAQQGAIQTLMRKNNKALAAGVTVSGISLAADPHSQTEFYSLVTTVQLAQSQRSDVTSLNAENISTQFGKITDAIGAMHDMTVAQFVTLMAEYAAAIGAARAAYQTKIAAINAATTVAAVSAID